MASCEVAIVGAGPYGLSVAIHLRRAGVEARVHGDPMSFWRGMPRGMLLRSNWGATNMVELKGKLSLEAYQGSTGARFKQPVPLEHFIAYGEWVQRRAVPDLDRRLISRIEERNGGFRLRLDDGETFDAGRVVVAGGIASFACMPPQLGELSPGLASHSSEHTDFGRFSGQHVAVVGGGQSALESAALLAEAGALPEVFVRSTRVIWLRGKGVKRMLGRVGPLVYAPTDVGPLWYSRLVAIPDLFRRLPRTAQDPIAYRSIRPAGAHWLKARLEGVPIRVGRLVVSARAEGDRVGLALDDGTAALFDHVLAGTGYNVDISRYPFLDQKLIDSLQTRSGYPVLTAGLESSVPGLHFVGAPAAWSFGPVMRFVSGTWYTGRAVTRAIVASSPRTSRHREVLRLA